MASEYRTALPDEKELAAEIERTQALLRDRRMIALPSPEALRMKKTRKNNTKFRSQKKDQKGNP
jgi:predicted secreted protein